MHGPVGGRSGKPRITKLKVDLHVKGSEESASFDSYAAVRLLDPSFHTIRTLVYATANHGSVASRELTCIAAQLDDQSCMRLDRRISLQFS